MAVDHAVDSLIERFDYYIVFCVGPNVSKSTGATTEDHSKSDNTDGSSFWSSFDTLKPGTHSTPKLGHSQPSSTDSLSFDEDSHWGTYFSPPQATSLPSSSKSTPKRSNSLEKSLSKHDKTSPTLLESSATTQSLPSPTIKSSKSGPLKLGSSKNKNRPKAKQVDAVKSDTQPDDSKTDVTKELATSSSDSFTTISSVNLNENNEKQQKPEDSYTHSSGDGQAVQPVTTSELLLLASAESTEVSSNSFSDVNRVTNSKENQLETPSVPVQHVITEDVDSTLAVSPVATNEPVDSQPATNEVNVAVVSEDVETDKVNTESDSNKVTVSSSVSVAPEEIIATPQSDEISSTAEYVIVSKEAIADEPTAEPVSDISKQLTELSQTSKAVSSNSTAEQKDVLQEEDKLEDKQTEQVTDNNSVEMQKPAEDENNLPTTDVIATVLDGIQASGDPQSHDKYYEELQQLKSVSLVYACNIHACEGIH